MAQKITQKENKAIKDKTEEEEHTGKSRLITQEEKVQSG